MAQTHAATSAQRVRLRNESEQPNGQNKNCGWCEDDDISLDAEMLGVTLPPMPTPDLSAMRSEASGGVSLVLCLIATFVTVTISFAHGLPTHAMVPLILCVSLEAAVALVCLAYLMFGDPGVVRRSQRACLPVPDQVQEKLIAHANAASDGTNPIHHPLAQMQNIKEDARSYCVRCCLWRDEPYITAWGRVKRVKLHHCSTCQRCVRDFDHHCGVFGRCIAGTWRSGNMPAFGLIITMGYCGAITAVAAAVTGLTSIVGGMVDGMNDANAAARSG